MLSHLGELAALATAICFTITATAFELAGKKVGSLPVNFIRLFIAFGLHGLCSHLTGGFVLPIDADSHTWIWLLISGLIGFVLGDLFLVKAYVEIGSRISLLIMSAAPPLTALIGFLAIGERISLLGLAGMLITMAGIGMVILSRNPAENKVQFNRPTQGIIFACIGALGQALGLICSKIGIGTYSPFAATQIRLIAALVGFAAIITIQGKWTEIRTALANKRAMLEISLGAVFGPFIGVACSLIAVKHTATGIVSSISSISPVIIIPASIMIFKEKVLFKEILGAFVSVIGVVILFL
ncbi:MAG: DMT family transporter [Firmicutes bacterium]|nr:DMT family transporter [Bacillota bacterium]